MRGLVVMVSTMVLLTGCMGEPVFHGEVLPSAQAQDFTLEMMRAFSDLDRHRSGRDHPRVHVHRMHGDVPRRERIDG